MSNWLLEYNYLPSLQHICVELSIYWMKFEIKTEPVCAVLIAVPAYAAIVAITIVTQVQVQNTWFPLTMVITIMLIAIGRIAPKKYHDGHR